MKNILLLTIIGFCLGVNGKNPEPTAQFRGMGRLNVKPDFIRLTIGVRSECYESPSAAQEETDKTVKLIEDFLQTLKKDDDRFFKILINGGFTGTFSRWYKDEEYCRNTFQKHTQIELKIGVSADLDRTFASLQSHLLSSFKRGLSSSEEQNPLTYVEISTPSPQIEDTHRESLFKRALGLAMLDAKARFLAATKSCKPSKWKVLSVREENTQVYTPAPRLYAARAKMPGSSNEEAIAPLSFDDLKIEASLDVTFGFDGSLCYEPF